MILERTSWVHVVKRAHDWQQRPLEQSMRAFCGFNGF